MTYPVMNSADIAAAGGMLSNGVFNLKASNMRHWGKAKAAARAGLARPKLAFVGDSTTRGEHSGSGTGGYTNQRIHRHSYIAAQALSIGGVTYKTDSLWGGSNQTLANTLAEDSRLALGADWSIDTHTALGGLLFTQSTGSSAMSLMLNNVDTLVVGYAQASANGSFTIDADGGSPLATINSAGASALVLATVTTTLGNHTFNIKHSAGGPIFIGGLNGYKSAAVNEIDVFNWGWGGSKIEDWISTSSAFGPYNALSVVPADLYVVNLGINNWTIPTDIATFTANYQTLITKLKIYGDVVICIPAPSSTTRASLATQAAYAAALYDLANTNDLPVIDFTYRLGSYDSANTLGEYYDTLHPNGYGQADMAEPIIRALAAA